MRQCSTAGLSNGCHSQNREQSRDPTQTNSVISTVSPRCVKNLCGSSGDTSMGRNGKKYRVLSNGAKKATPTPPLVMASNTPCELIAKKKNQPRRRRSTLEESR